MYDNIIYFSDFVPGKEKDEYGDARLEEKRSEAVWAKKKSIGQTEFYQAQTAGMKPEIKFVIADYMDYAGQQYLICDGMRYKILKIYGADGKNDLEITCYGGVRDVGTAVSDQNQ